MKYGNSFMIYLFCFHGNCIKLGPDHCFYTQKWVTAKDRTTVLYSYQKQTLKILLMEITGILTKLYSFKSQSVRKSKFKK